MRNSDFGGRSYLPPGNGPLNYGHDLFCLHAVILCQVGGRPNVWHELKHCKTETERGSYLVFSIGQLFVVLKTSGNAHTLLYIGLLSNLFVTNTID